MRASALQGHLVPRMTAAGTAELPTGSPRPSEQSPCAGLKSPQGHRIRVRYISAPAATLSLVGREHLRQNWRLLPVPFFHDLAGHIQIQRITRCKEVVPEGSSWCGRSYQCSFAAPVDRADTVASPCPPRPPERNPGAGLKLPQGPDDGGPTATSKYGRGAKFFYLHGSPFVLCGT